MKRLFSPNRSKLRKVRHARVRSTVIGTSAKPRLSVFRSLKSITAQLIDDSKGRTICHANSKDVKKEKVEGYASKATASYLAGKLLAEKAKEKKITEVVFDRGGYAYLGRVRALAEGARAGGLKF